LRKARFEDFYFKSLFAEKFAETKPIFWPNKKTPWDVFWQRANDYPFTPVFRIRIRIYPAFLDLDPIPHWQLAIGITSRSHETGKN
jgi:hypothetical protein